MSEKKQGCVRLMSWNVNSVRARLDLIGRVIDKYAPDILCLQETKAMDDVFPLAWFEERGFRCNAIRGQKSYNGVAILARGAAIDPGSAGSAANIDWCGRGDARHISVGLPGGVALHNFYVPAGGDVPDPAANDKFAHKLQFLDEMIAWSGGLTGPAILVGDLNVAPEECDVWSHKALLKIVSHTPVETDRLRALQQAHGWVDAVRQQFPAPEKIYSWWSYRSPDWAKADKGRRLDHIWLSPAIEKALVYVQVARDARGWEKPSDHAPLMADLRLPA